MYLHLLRLRLLFLPYPHLSHMMSWLYRLYLYRLPHRCSPTAPVVPTRGRISPTPPAPPAAPAAPAAPPSPASPAARPAAALLPALVGRSSGGQVKGRAFPSRQACHGHLILGRMG